MYGVRRTPLRNPEHTKLFILQQEFLRSTLSNSYSIDYSLRKEFTFAILRGSSPSQRAHQWLTPSEVQSYGYRFPKEQPPAPRSRNLPSWPDISWFPDGIEGVSAATCPLKFKNSVWHKTRSIRIAIVYAVQCKYS